MLGHTVRQERGGWGRQVIIRTPLAYAVWWKRNIYLGMAVHMPLNGLSTTVLIVTVVGKLA